MFAHFRHQKIISVVIPTDIYFLFNVLKVSKFQKQIWNLLTFMDKTSWKRIIEFVFWVKKGRKDRWRHVHWPNTSNLLRFSSKDFLHFWLMLFTADSRNKCQIKFELKYKGLRKRFPFFFPFIIFEMFWPTTNQKNSFLIMYKSGHELIIN